MENYLTIHENENRISSLLTLNKKLTIEISEIGIIILDGNGHVARELEFKKEWLESHTEQEIRDELINKLKLII